MSERRKLGWETWCSWLILALVIFFILFYWIASEQLNRREYTIGTVTADSFTKELVDGSTVEQSFLMPYDSLEKVSVMIGTYGRTNEGSLKLQLIENGDQVLVEKDIPTNTLATDGYLSFQSGDTITGIQGKKLILRLIAHNTGAGNGVSLLYNLNEADGSKFSIDGEEQDGKLNYILAGHEVLLYGRLYWPLAAITVIALCVICAWTVGLKRRGKDNLVLRTIRVNRQYGFLTHQLVSRDFKTKYKRSVLGMLWSFLNPLVTMAVQYIVFSTLFKPNIPYFAIYLLTGVLMFGFFTEAVGQGILSIVSNANLITKVYLPKYIYPISKVLSSAINLAISLIPLLLMILVMGLPFTRALFLIPLGLIFLLLFSMGMALMLSTAMVFFRDTQFLWGIVSMLWTYLTPIFYPETIIPFQFLGLYRCNPMYQYITFMRTVIIDGRSPDPTAYMWCFLYSVFVLLLGLWIFKKSQDRFVFYL